MPTNVGAFTSSNMALNGQTASGTITSIPAGESAVLWFQVNASGTGTPLFLAQIGGSSTPDYDSVPNNGFTNGEDDTAQVSVRIR
jgi:hypothetical protein